MEAGHNDLLRCAVSLARRCADRTVYVGTRLTRTILCKSCIGESMKFDWWTLLLQTINVAVLIWILQRFLFKPILSLIAQRQQAIQQATDAAIAAQQQAEQERTGLALERSKLDHAQTQILAAAQAEAQQIRSKLLAQAQQEAKQLITAAQEDIKQSIEAAGLTLCHQAQLLASAITRRLLTRLPITSLNHYFIEDACQQLAASLATDNVSKFNTDSEMIFTIISAEALTGEEQALLQTKLNALSNLPVTLNFSVDQALIAGIELHSRYLLIRNSWAADLEKIAQQLQHDAEL